MRILITGVAGFLGFHLSEKFLALGHVVVGIDNFITGDPENILELEFSPKFDFLSHDVAEPFDYPLPIDAVLHFASPASPNALSPYSYINAPIQTLQAGSLGTFNSLNIAQKNHARFLLASTSEVYGDPFENPQKESYWGNVNPVGIRSVYDEAKRFAEAATMAYWRKHQVSTHIARIFNTYGPHMKIDDGRVIPNMVEQALKKKPVTVYGDGLQTRSFCYVSDLVEGIARLLMSDEAFPVNLGNPNEITILQLAQKINQITHNPAGIEFKPKLRGENDPQLRCPDITRAREILKWKPQIELDEGLSRTIDYFQKKIAKY